MLHPLGPSSVLRIQVSVQIVIPLIFYSSEFILLIFYSCMHLQSAGVCCDCCDCIVSQECDSVTSALFLSLSVLHCSWQSLISLLDSLSGSYFTVNLSSFPETETVCQLVQPLILTKWAYMTSNSPLALSPCLDLGTVFFICFPRTQYWQMGGKVDRSAGIPATVPCLAIWTMDVIDMSKLLMPCF